MSCEFTPDLKRIFRHARLLTTHTPPAKDPTLNCYSSVRLGRVSFADRSRNCIKHLHKADFKNNVLIVMLILWVYLQRVVKMVRNLIQSVLWPLVLRVCDKETS